MKTILQQFIYYRTYSRWIEEKKRRENWDETVDRYIEFFKDYLFKNHKFQGDELFKIISSYILDHKVMPSMRALWSAGPALERDHIAGYNCSYTPIDSISTFSEILYILSCGTGVGYSVERQYINKLPEVPDTLDFPESYYPPIIVEDSKQGWAKALNTLLTELYKGFIRGWDVSKIRPQGARLKTFGGRASGPEPLENLFKFIIEVFKKAKGRKLNSLEVHDIVCKIADVIISGGVRRSSLISLSNLSDQRMAKAKSGDWYNQNPYRGSANNSVSYTEKPEMGHFMTEWQELYNSKSGERGIFNRVAAKSTCSNIGRADNYEFGTNPCGEIILRPNQFCNLSEVIARENDTLETLLKKVEIATILGTFQSCLTNFNFINKNWELNCSEERLLGVSITGIMDCPILRKNGLKLESILNTLKQKASLTNKKYSKILGIPASKAITCIKPSGTVSQLVDSSSGIHPRFASKYVRRITSDSKDPITTFLEDRHIPSENIKYKKDQKMLLFPIEAPKGSITDIDTMEFLELYLTYKKYWCDHNPSITVYVKENEWLKVGAWVYDHFEEIGGISFLPTNNVIYDQMPYTKSNDLTDLREKIPQKIDWKNLSIYENEDNTTGAQELACDSEACEIKGV